ncbi:MAG: DNA-binding protein [Proteobacteria bacterium]|nr:MAG: DNA-binding protein [Pseudomonadota bacterium]
MDWRQRVINQESGSLNMSKFRDLDQSYCKGFEKRELAQFACSHEPDPHSESIGPKRLIENQTDLMEIEDVASYLGLAPQTIRNWLAKRKLPFLKLGKRHVIRRGSLEAWILQREWKPWQ